MGCSILQYLWRSQENGRLLPLLWFSSTHRLRLKWCQFVTLTSPICHLKSVSYTIVRLMTRTVTPVGYTFTGKIMPQLEHMMRATMATMLYLRSFNRCHVTVEKSPSVCIKISWGCTNEIYNSLVSCPCISYTLVLRCQQLYKSTRSIVSELL